jgi:predicted nucleic acid-binding protein
VEAYLLDTSALTPLVDAGHVKHHAACAKIAALGSAPIYVSVIALAEMQYGFLMHEKFAGSILPDADKMMNKALGYPRLDILAHTATAYADLKSSLAKHYLPTPKKEFRKKHVEEWVDQFTGKPLAVDDNDIWVCAQAREMNFVVIAGDKMERIRQADPFLKHLLIG